MSRENVEHPQSATPTLPLATVFGSRLSPFVEKVVRALKLKGFRISLVEPKSPADFKRWNPQTGKMPVLEIDGERVYDSTFILRRLDELCPQPPLFEEDPVIAARQRFLEDWSDESLYWYIMGLRWCDQNAKATATQIVAALPVPPLVRPLLRLVIPRQIKRQAIAQGMARLPLETLLEELGRRLDELLVLLENKPFFFADRPSAADLAIFGQLNTLQSGPTPQGERLVAERGNLLAWARRVDAVTGA